MRSHFSLFTLLVPSFFATLSCAAVSSLGAGCSSNSVQATSDGGADAGSVDASPRDASSGTQRDAAPTKRVDARGRTCDLPADATGPGGWDVITDYSCTCPLYAPSQELMAREPPEPLRWRPCPLPGPQGIGCQQLVPELIDGTPVVYAASIDGSFAVDGTTMRPILALMREPKNGDFQDALVAEVDGKVRRFIRNPTPNRRGAASGFCWSDAVSTNGIGAALAFVDDNTPLPDTHSGVFGYVAWTNKGDVRAANDPWTTDLGHGSSTVRGDWLTHYAVGGTITGESLSTGERVAMISPGAQPDGRPSLLIPAGRTMFFEVGGGGIATIYSWTPEAGLRPFLRTAADGRPADRDRGDGMIATDGRDIVWIHAEQMDPDPQNLYIYAVSDLMTSPFTADRAQLRPRRLRSDPHRGFGPARATAVGCGFYAASGASALPDLSTRDMMVVRISDGRTWWIRGNAGTHCDATSCDRFEWRGPLGISCEPGKPPELFAKGSVLGDGSTVLRVPIDLTKLGPGIPAD